VDKLTETQGLLKYQHLVYEVVSRFMQKCPTHIERDELLNVGRVGLLQALQTNTSEIEGQFEYYARIRIRGSIVDELRTQDYFSRRTRRKLKLDGDNPRFFIQYFNDTFREDNLVDSSKSPEEQLIECDERNRIFQVIHNLTEREKAVVQLVLLGKRQIDISTELGITGPRVAQLVSQAVLKLRVLVKNPIRIPAPPKSVKRVSSRYRGRTVGTLNSKTRDNIVIVQRLYSEGKSLRDIEKITGMHRSTIAKFVPSRSKSDAMRFKHQTWKAEGRPILPPWELSRRKTVGNDLEDFIVPFGATPIKILKSA